MKPVNFFTEKNIWRGESPIHDVTHPGVFLDQPSNFLQHDAGKVPFMTSYTRGIPTQCSKINNSFSNSNHHNSDQSRHFAFFEFQIITILTNHETPYHNAYVIAENTDHATKKHTGTRIRGYIAENAYSVTDNCGLLHNAYCGSAV